jgi:hypothetical protein
MTKKVDTYSDSQTLAFDIVQMLHAHNASYSVALLAVDRARNLLQTVLDNELEYLPLADGIKMENISPHTHS